MLFYKPETYLLPSHTQSPQLASRHSQFTNGYSVKADYDPTKGASGDPYKPPVRYNDILKQKQIE